MIVEEAKTLLCNTNGFCFRTDRQISGHLFCDSRVTFATENGRAMREQYEKIAIVFTKYHPSIHFAAVVVEADS